MQKKKKGGRNNIRKREWGVVIINQKETRNPPRRLAVCWGWGVQQINVREWVHVKRRNLEADERKGKQRGCKRGHEIIGTHRMGPTWWGEAPGKHLSNMNAESSKASEKPGQWWEKKRIKAKGWGGGRSSRGGWDPEKARP